ncbi:hydroxyacid dehydrogenase [archaeon]|jgi:lactate dehydrogenase-like 2-hydroxyacid dehydrogenase|nr:hydroxyacid dehydrogenase [archaeon]MBT4351040.1 hydroxyacid dehydrogenase [archaeon]MBT4648546.1 hydroxyacid dehydrogenase [archaeon]MBT6821365.1 hydroxyacid dehydrogenase [archaeon]MBT7391952.1 hydroxyacid dehydrogenase [archaeon]
MKCAIIEPIGATDKKILDFRKKLEHYNVELKTYDSRPNSNQEIIERVKDADMVIISNLPFSSVVINECKNLKMLSVAFTGCDHIDLNVCKENNIIVSNSSGYSTNSVAELAISLMIAVLRKIVWGDKKIRELSTREGFLGTELKGKTLGVIGTGAIGLRLIEIAKAFGCKIIAYSRTKKEGIYYVGLNELLSKSDIVSLHLPLNKETKHLINQEKLNLMKQESIIINTARGGIIDNDALAKNLSNNLIAGAGLDSVDMEPPLEKNYPLLFSPNTIIVPHIGYATKEAINIRTEIVFENIIRFLNNKIQNRVV